MQGLQDAIDDAISKNNKTDLNSLVINDVPVSIPTEDSLVDMFLDNIIGLLISSFKTWIKHLTI